MTRQTMTLVHEGRVMNDRCQLRRCDNLAILHAMHETSLVSYYRNRCYRL